MYNVYHPWHARLLLLLARLSVGMTDDDATKLEAALTPLIHTAQEQVVIIHPSYTYCSRTGCHHDVMDNRKKNTKTHYCVFLSTKINLRFCHRIKIHHGKKDSHDNDDDT